MQSCRFQMSFIGRQRIITSVMRFDPTKPLYSFSPLIQWLPGMFGVQAAATGLHWKKKASIPEMNHATQMEPTTMVAAWKPGVVKTRRYRQRIEILVAVIAPKYRIELAKND